MKRKIASRPDWARLTRKRYFQQHIASDRFTGFVCFLLLDQVKAPLGVKYEEREVCIVDNGYAWIMLFPESKPYCVTIMTDNGGNVLQWYFDIIHSLEYTSEGVPVAVDLYLDLVVLPDGTTYVLDKDELDDALQEGVISMESHANAIQALEELHAEVQQGRHMLIRHTDLYLTMLNEYRTLSGGSPDNR